jgi:hypothetical protein
MTSAYPRAPLAARLAWAASLIVLLALAALLLGATRSSAAPAPTAASSYPNSEGEAEEQEELAEEAEEEAGYEEAPDWDAEGWEEEELGGTDCELGHEALAEGLLSATDVEELCAAEREWEEEAEGRSREGREARSSCAVRRARARVSTRRNHLKLTIGYAVAAPAKARIEVRAGKRKLASVSRRLDGNGVIHLRKRVGKRLGNQLDKRSGRRVKLSIKIPRGATACPSRRLVLFAK